jgi:hypothetical protein
VSYGQKIGAGFATGPDLLPKLRRKTASKLVIADGSDERGWTLYYTEELSSFG